MIIFIAIKHAYFAHLSSFQTIYLLYQLTAVNSLGQYILHLIAQVLEWQICLLML